MFDISWYILRCIWIDLGWCVGSCSSLCSVGVRSFFKFDFARCFFRENDDIFLGLADLGVSEVLDFVVLCILFQERLDLLGGLWLHTHTPKDHAMHLFARSFKFKRHNLSPRFWYALHKSFSISAIMYHCLHCRAMMMVHLEPVHWRLFRHGQSFESHGFFCSVASCGLFLLLFGWGRLSLYLNLRLRRWAAAASFRVTTRTWTIADRLWIAWILSLLRFQSVIFHKCHGQPSPNIILKFFLQLIFLFLPVHLLAAVLLFNFGLRSFGWRFRRLISLNIAIGVAEKILIQRHSIFILVLFLYFEILNLVQIVSDLPIKFWNILLFVIFGCNGI